MREQELEPINAHIARAVRRERRIQDKTLATLADEVGVSFQQMHKYETGQSQISAGRLFRIARALGAPIERFLPEHTQVMAAA